MAASPPAAFGWPAASNIECSVWVCKQAHRQLKEELGLDHFEGRSRTGLHQHALMIMNVYAFLQSRRLKAAGRKKGIDGPPPRPAMPAVRNAILNVFAKLPPRRCPHCDRPLTKKRHYKYAKVVLSPQRFHHLLPHQEFLHLVRHRHRKFLNKSDHRRNLVMRNLP